jgi:prephenate dehydratase
VEGHPDHRSLQLAFEELSFFTSELHILGTYPAHEYRKALNGKK